MDPLINPQILNLAQVLVVNSSHSISYWNQGDEKLYGWTNSEAFGKDINELLQTVFPQPLDEIEHQLSIAGIWEGELLQTRKDGIRLTLTSHWVMQSNERGEIIAILQFNHVVSEYKHTSNAMFDTENRFPGAIDNTEAGYFFIDRNGLFQHVNKAWLRMHGFSSSEEIIGHPFALTQIDKDLPQAQKIVEIILNGKTISNAEFTRRNKDGTVGYHLFSANAVHQGETLIGLEGFLLDITERKLAEKRCEQLTQRYRDLYENSGTGIVIIDENGQYILANKQAAASFGKSPNEIIGKSMFDLLPEETAQKYLEFNRELLDTGGNRKYEDTFELPTGVRSFLIVDQCIQDEQGRNFAVQSSSIDITERKRIEEALRESEELYRQTVSSISDAVFLTDDRGKFIFVCPNVDLTFGWSEAEIMSMGNITSLVGHTPYIPIEIEGELRNIEWEITDKIGNLHSLLVNIKSVNIGKATRLFACRDVTERKSAEDALRKSEARLAAAQHLAQLGSWEWDTGMDTAIWSDETFRIFGIIPGSLNEHRQNFLDMVHPDDKDRVNQALSEALNGSRKYDLEFRIILPNNQIRFIHSLAEVILDDPGHPPRMRGTVHDITERKQAEERVQEAYRFAQNTIDAISAHICVVDEHGVILAVNKAWRDFADDNPPAPTDYCIGMNYLDVCDKASGPNSAEAIPFAIGLRAVIKGDIDRFVMEYPCHDSGKEKRWFSARITHFAKGNPLRIVITHQNITDRKLAEIKVAEYTAQLHSLSQRQTELQENERRSIARELHDEVGQVMTAVKTNLETIKLSPGPETLSDQLNESISIVDRTLDQIRTLALNLRPSLLDDFGLGPTLEWYLERQARGAPYKINFKSNLYEVRLPPTIETTCFRVVQAAMTNISRHSQATRVDVKLNWYPNSKKIKLTVHDNGIGFDVQKAMERARHGESLGILGLQERVHLVGGEILFDSAPGRGTKILVSIPVTTE